MTPKGAITLLDRIATGELKPGTSYGWVYDEMSRGEPAELSAEDEILAWETYRRYAAFVEPHVAFHRDGVANGFELRRRRVLTGMFFIVGFRTQCRRIEGLFKESVGSLSLKEMMGFCGPRMPHFYYRWAFDVLPLSKKTFGPAALSGFKERPDHLRTFSELGRAKDDLLAVRRVMES